MNAPVASASLIERLAARAALHEEEAVTFGNPMADSDANSAALLREAITRLSEGDADMEEGISLPFRIRIDELKRELADVTAQRDAFQILLEEFGFCRQPDGMWRFTEAPK